MPRTDCQGQNLYGAKSQVIVSTYLMAHIIQKHIFLLASPPRNLLIVLILLIYICCTRYKYRNTYVKSTSRSIWSVSSNVSAILTSLTKTLLYLGMKSVIADYLVCPHSDEECFHTASEISWFARIFFNRLTFSSQLSLAFFSQLICCFYFITISIKRQGTVKNTVVHI